uniref:Partitioning defective 3 homolog B-like n=1 Tax=Phallusia mammillata TaxID=59560 RepID=A0A6F9DMK2_9ASCI|nr:partitioning defective 3 homolog B-like [Phallusia mammillata]
MKVTVCFGNIRVVVPCGKDNLTVADLQKQACARYRKIIGKSSDYWVRILQLGSAVDGGILDWDDLVQDVVEDKEKLIAVFEEEEVQHADWDLSSAVSSDDRSTPQRPAVKHPSYELSNGGSRQRYMDHGSLGSSFYSRDSSLEVDVGIETLKSNSQIVVRQESDSSFNAAGVMHNHNSPLNSMSQAEQSRYNGRDNGEQRRPSRYSRRSRESNSTSREEPNNNKALSENDSKVYFKRDKFRQSMASGLSESLDSESPSYNQAERDYFYDNSYQSDLSANLADNIRQLSFAERLNLPWFYRESQELLLINDGTPLGFQVGSYHDPKSNKFVGLVVKSITAGSRVDRENLLQPGDLIVEINHRVLLDLSPDVAHAILKESLYYHELQFRILPVEERDRHIPSPTRKKQSSVPPALTLTMPSPQAISESNSALSASQLSASASSMSTHESPSASPTSKVPLIAQQSYDNVSLYTRKIGNQITISFKKDAQGLGFSITARDTTTIGDPGPIYIKNILPKGAAIVDGRLRAGDRLLSVNDQELSGLSQEEAVKILRSVPSGSVVNLTISRQSETLPRKLQDDPITDKMINEDNSREYFMFEIPLNDTGSAGLGISLKGNQSKKTGQDLGIFVKAVFHGGAAWQDGRLKANDQLIQVNGRSLTGVTNHEAIDILRASMSTEGNVRGMIQMVVARRKVSQNGLSSRVSSEASSDLSDSILDQFHNLTKPDAPAHVHVKQASMPSLLMETSFGPEDISEVNTSFQCTTLDRSTRRGRSTATGAVARRISSQNHKRSRSVSNDADKLDVEVVSKVREKILNSSTSSFLSNLIRSSVASPTPSTQPTAPGVYATWTIPRTHRVPKRSLSLKNIKGDVDSLIANTSVSEDSRRSAFEAITANEITETDASVVNPSGDQQQSSHQRNEGTFSSVSSNEHSSQRARPTSPVNPDVVVSEDDWPMSPSYDPFNRESAIRQSISEKRRDAVTRYFPNGDGPKNAKNKHNTEIGKKEAEPKKVNHVRNLSSPVSLNKSKYNSKNSNNSSSAGSHQNLSPQPSQDDSVAISRTPIAVVELNPPADNSLSTNGFRKSISTESLAATANAVQATAPVSNGSKYFTPHFLDLPGRNVDVGPTLGIAKSSSLESLQTAVESCFASETSKENPYPRPMPRVVRGRVLNDSFRAALDRSYDMSGEIPTIKQMETDNNVREEESFRTSATSSSEDSVLKLNKKRSNAKGTKLFGLFKINKTKRSPDAHMKSRVSENELHKQHLEARRERDFERMKEENERIQAKARELRSKQAEEQKRVNTNYERPRPPSVPVTAMQRIKHDDPITWYKESASGRHSVDPTAMQNHRYASGGGRRHEPTSPDPRYNKHDQIPSPPPRSIKHLKKDEHRKFSENVNTYSSLPRQPRRGSRSTDDESQHHQYGRMNSAEEVSPNLRHTGSGRVSSSRIENLEFYNRQKPNSVRKRSPPRPQVPAGSMAGGKAPLKKSPSHDDGRKGRTLYYDDTEKTEPSRNLYGSKGQHGYHQREKSPEPPPQSFYVIQTESQNTSQNRVSPSIVVRRSAVSPGGARAPRWVHPNQRHSVYTDTPSKFYTTTTPQVRSPSFQSGPVKAKPFSPSNQRGNGSMASQTQVRRVSSPSTSEIADRNREAYHKLMQSRRNEDSDGTYEKIEISAPYNL